MTGGVSQTSLFDASGWSGGIGYRLGASFSLPLGTWFRLEPEVAWARRTTVAKGTVDSGTVENRVALQYLEVPVLAKWSFWRRGRFAPLAVGGVYYAAKLHAGVHTSIPGHTLNEDIGPEVKRSDAGWIVGGGVQFRQPTRTWTVEVRYLAGFVNINASENTNPNRWLTRSLTTTVGMRW